jgi:hypothetical protein
MARVALLTMSDYPVRAFPGFTMPAARATSAPLLLRGSIDPARSLGNGPRRAPGGLSDWAGYSALRDGNATLATGMDR